MIEATTTLTRADMLYALRLPGGQRALAAAPEIAVRSTNLPTKVFENPRWQMIRP